LVFKAQGMGGFSLLLIAGLFAARRFSFADVMARQQHPINPGWR
jgi:hypothetical protein